MKIQINTDNNIVGREQMVNHYETVLTDALSRFSDHITRLEVHLSDENSHKEGTEDKRCLLEARIENLKPLAVSHNAPSLHEAVSGSIEKLKKSMDSALGKLRNY
ncbi:HPF/RaiA family ribosome-associated protein [Daejeonella oryzae]|uniref:HPF/RaiA family ribosome-associated protein n=1 Tax=Daejeonella oryzae TaxID=1122943 RepID=UPI00040F3035|nr:HPF/RaiA family ribosome-associated protein [Daejeonella oryzae]